MCWVLVLVPRITKEVKRNGMKEKEEKEEEGMSNIRQAIHGLAFEEDERGGRGRSRGDETYI